MNPAPNPIPILHYQTPAPAARPKLRAFTRIFLILGSIAALIALILIPLLNVRTVIITGPILLTLSVITLIAAMRLRHPFAAIVGGANSFICLLFLFLVNALGWSPDQAHCPFIIMGTLHVLITVPLTILAFIKMPPKFSQPAS